MEETSGDGATDRGRASLRDSIRLFGDWERATGELASWTTYGMSHDGEALLLQMPVDDRGAPVEVTVVVDWLAELERLVPR